MFARTRSLGKIVDRPYQLLLGSIGSQRCIGPASLLTRLGDYLTGVLAAAISNVNAMG
jgi:hypothetical protein